MVDKGGGADDVHDHADRHVTQPYAKDLQRNRVAETGIASYGFGQDLWQCVFRGIVQRQNQFIVEQHDTAHRTASQGVGDACVIGVCVAFDGDQLTFSLIQFKGPC